MKKINFNLIRKIAFIALGAGWLLTAGLFVGVSYLNYLGYYNEMIELKQQIDEANREPVTTLNGITLTVAEGKEYFDNGKAHPVKADFVLYGNYDTDGRPFDEELTDYTIEIPQDFTENGGTIKATYVHTYTVEEEVPVEGGFEGETEIVEVTKEQTFTCNLVIDLTPVAPKKLVVMENPYLVRYKAGTKFNTEGLEVIVEYNDGSVFEDVVMENVTAETKDLTEEDTEVTVYYEHDGVTVEGKVEVEVMSATDFTNGRVIDLMVEDTLTLTAGQDLTAAVPNVRAVYDSGNKIKMQTGEYTVSSQNEKVAIGKDYSLELQCVAFPEVRKKVNVAVVATAEAESGTLVGCTASNGVITGIGDGSSISVKFTSNKATYVSLYAKMSNGYIEQRDGKYYAKAFEVGEIVKVYVNGKLKEVANTSLKAGGPYDTAEQALSVLNNVYLGEFYFINGENTVNVEFKSSNSGLKNYQNQDVFGRLDNIGVRCYDDAAIYSTYGEYIEYVAKNNLIENVTVSSQASWRQYANKNFIEDATTDGKFIYYLASSSGKAVESEGGYKQYVSIVKYDPETGTVKGYSAQFYAKSHSQWAYGQYMWLYYKDGYVYTMNSDGVAKKIAVSNLETNGTNAVVDVAEGEFTFKNGLAINGMSYNSIMQRYVQLENNNIKIYDATQTQIGSFNLKSSTSNCGSAYNMFANAKYIYVLYQKDNVITPCVQIYNWNGDLIKETIIANTPTVMNYNFTTCNVQSIVEVGSTLYYSLISWTNAPAGTFIGKVQFNVETVEEPERLSLGEYFEKCADSSVEMNYTANSIKLSGVGTYVHGSATDGKYAYVASNLSSTPYQMRIYKIDLQTGKAVGSTAPISRVQQSENADYLFYKNGYIYVATNTADVGRNVYKVRALDIDASNSAQLVNATEFDAFDGTIAAISYNASHNKYVLLASGNIKIVNGATYTVEKTFSAGLGSKKSTGIYCDENHIYVFYEGGNNGNAFFNLFDWSGTLVSSVTLPAVFPGTSNNNVQSMFVINGSVYFTVCAWGASKDANNKEVLAGNYIVKVDLDYGVFSN